MRLYRRLKDNLLQTFILLFLLEVIMLPVVLSNTFATNSEATRILTLNKDKSLTWDSGAKPDDLGGINLGLANQLKKSEDGKYRLLMPGVDMDANLKFINNSQMDIAYKAVLYQQSFDENLPIDATIWADGLVEDKKSDLENRLPEKIKNAKIKRIYSGKLAKGKTQNFYAKWQWPFSENDDLDTRLGDGAVTNLQDIRLGLIIYVEEDNDFVKDNHNSSEEGHEDLKDTHNFVEPKGVNTGDGLIVGGYIALMIVSGTIVILLRYRYRKET